MADKNRKAPNEKYTPAMKEKAIMLYATNGSYTDTAEELGIAKSTVYDWINTDENKELLGKVRTEKLQEFADNAGRIINKGLKLLERRLNTAIEHEDELDEIIEEIWSTDGKEMRQDQKQRLVQTIKGLQLQKVSEITTAVGTLYDKRALAQGDPTSRVEGKLSLSEIIGDEY